jgi:TonB family protein
MPKGLPIVCFAVALATATALSCTTEQSKEPSLSKQVMVSPKVLFNPLPIYPHDHKVDGAVVDPAVVLSGYVGTDGKFHDPKVVTSLDPTLDDLAVEAVGRWKFTPATRDGVPVNLPVTTRVKFKLAP